MKQLLALSKVKQEGNETTSSNQKKNSDKASFNTKYLLYPAINNSILCRFIVLRFNG